MVNGDRSVTFSVTRNASLDSIVDFYPINADGSVTDSTGTTIALGETGYLEAAIANRLGLDLTTENKQTTEFSATLEGDSIYAPLMVVNGEFARLADGDTSNDPFVYFPFAEANADGVEHISSLEATSLGFEDLFGGGDSDFDDLIVEISGLDITEESEQIFGTIGEDTIEVLGSGRLIFAGDSNDLIDASTGSGNNRLDAGNGDDTLILGESDRVLAGEGNDTIFITRSGDNIITGGEGADSFWIASAEIPESANIITDFTGSEDIIGIAGLGISFEDVSITTAGGNALIAVDDSNLAIIQGVSADRLSVDDFTFA